MADELVHTFPDVEVSIPGGQGGEANFVKWTVGRLDVGANLDVIIHLPALPVGSLEPKSLGCLTRASAVPQDESGRSLDVKMGKSSVQNLYRLVFRSARDAEAVAGLAEKAMMEEFNDWEASGKARDAQAKALLAAVKDSLSGRRPLLYQGVQLLGPDPHGDAGSEVLLGEGVLGLLDPNWRDGVDISNQAGSRDIGEYEVVFYSEESGAAKPVQRIPVGPGMKLELQERKRAEVDDEEEPAKTYQLQTMGGSGPVFTLTFESVEVADFFERDFVVRSRLMGVGLMTAQNLQEIGQLRYQLRSSSSSHIARLAPLMLLVPAGIMMWAYASESFATSYCQHLLPFQCIVPCSKVIEGL